MIKSFCLLNFFLLVQISSSQEADNEVIYDEETEYLHTYPNRITARLHYINTSNPVKVNDRKSDYSVDLVPNKEDRIGASVAFRSIALSYSLTPDFLSNNQGNKDSKLLNLGIRTYFGKHFMQTIELYKAKGFYIEDRNFQSYFPDIKSTKIGGATSFIFNKNFSFRAIVTQDEKQLKSVGSFIPRLFYYYTSYNIRVKGDIPEESLDSKLKSLDIGIAPAYYYNFVPTKNLFLSAGISAGIGINHSFDNTGEDDLTSLLTEFNFRSSATYDFDDFYLGAHYNYLLLNHDTDSNSYVNDNIPLLEIFLGYRFKAPKKLIGKAEQLNRKLKI